MYTLHKRVLLFYTHCSTVYETYVSGSQPGGYPQIKNMCYFKMSNKLSATQSCVIVFFNLGFLSLGQLLIAHTFMQMRL